MLLDRISKYLNGIVDTMLRTVRRQLEVEGMQMNLTQIEVSQSITVAGSLELSLQRVFEFSAGGELSLAASYAVPDATAGAK